jgi:mono/diheme cytochrome c family protein
MTTAAVLSLAVAIAAGCGKPAAGSPAPPADGTPAAAPAAGPAITAEARQEARQIFSTRCSVCHGPEGYGDGPGASALTPRPRNYHDGDWQHQTTDQQIEMAIQYGGAAVGKSPAMVANPDLGSKPAVLAALRELIREFGKTPGTRESGPPASPAGRQ